MDYNPSERAWDLLHAAQNGDPWLTGDRVQKLINDYTTAFETANPDSETYRPGRTDEDVINYLGAGLVAQIILLGDVLDSPVDLAESLKDQIESLIESLKPPKTGIDLIYEFRWGSDMPGDEPHTKVFRQNTEDMEEACRLTRNEAHRLGLPLDGKIVHAENRQRYPR